MITDAILGFLGIVSLCSYLGQQEVDIVKTLGNLILSNPKESPRQSMDFVKQVLMEMRGQILVLFLFSMQLCFLVTALAVRSKGLMHLVAWLRYIGLWAGLITFIAGLVVLSMLLKCPKTSPAALHRLVLITIIWATCFPIHLIWDFFAVKAGVSFCQQVEKAELAGYGGNPHGEENRQLLQEAPVTYASTV